MEKKKNTPPSRRFQPVNGWDNLPKAEEKLLEKHADRYLEFLQKCKTERETLTHLEESAKKDGFKLVSPDSSPRKLTPGSRVMFISKNRAMGLAVIGKRPVEKGFHVVAAHHDVPHLDLKALPIFEKHGLALLRTHYYGGVKKFQWCAIPLALHGFAITKSGKTVSFQIGEKQGEPVFTITDVPPHLSYKVQNDRKATEVFKGEELNILVGSKPLPKNKDTAKGEERVKNAVLEHLFRTYGLEEEDLAWAEIAAVPAFEPREVGLSREMIGGFGHDDRSCVMAAYEAIRNVKVPEHTAVVLLLDKEEIGSAGSSGAQSMMIPDFFNLLVHLQTGGTSYTLLRQSLSESMVLSGDTNAPIDPTFEAAWDSSNAGLLGNGVWICKFTGAGGKSGSSEADVEFIAGIRRLLTRRKIPYQFGEMGKVDEGGGGTVAKFFAQLNMNVLDLALPVLGLHSPFEVLSKVDYHATIAAYQAFMEEKL